MAAVGKNKKVRSKKWGRLPGLALSLVRNLGVALRRYIYGLRNFVFATPKWLRSRPAAFKRWRKEEKKKKKYRSFKLQKKIKPEPRAIPTSLALLKGSLRFIWSNKRVFAALLFIYGLIYFLLIRTPIPTDMESIQELVEVALGSGSQQSLEGNFATLGVVLGSAGTLQQNPTVAALGTLVLSLATVWATRQIHNQQILKARDAYYQGMTGVFPVLMVLMVLSLQLIPFAIASFVYTTARAGQLFVTGAEDLAFFIVALLIGLLSFYWITSTIIALYVASLPGMYPLKALRAAKKLVKFQRFMVFRRIIALPVVLGVAYALILLLVIRFLPSRAFLAAEVMQLLMIPLVNVYLYKLYRALI